MSLTQLEKHIQTNDLAPYYILLGEEEYLVQEAIKKIINTAIDEQTRFFNIDKIEAGNGRASEIIDKASIVPLMCKKRVVIVSHADKYNKDDLERLTGYMNNPIESTCLLICANTIDAHSELFTIAKKKGAILDFSSLRGSQLLSWCREKVKEYDCSMDKGVENYLVDLIGTDLWQLDNEINKLSVYVGKGKKITVETVDELVSQVSTNSIFELTDALGNKDLKKSLLLLNRMLQTGQQPLMILSMITRQFRLIWQGISIKKTKVKPFELAQKLKINKMFIDKFIKQMNLFTYAELEDIFSHFYQVDLQLKSSSINPLRLLEMLVLRICSKGKDM
ncbi:MAG: DNA polymerase III subunit delta [bacterium]